MKANLSRLFLSPIAIFIVIFGVLAARSWNALLLPEGAVEDGRDMLAFYFNSPNPSSALRFYNGYALFIPDAIAWLATRGPITLAPYIFTLESLGFAAIGMFMISRPQFAWLIPNAIDRALVALLLAILPLGRAFLIQNLAYSLWSILFLLIVLLSYPLPRYSITLAAAIRSDHSVYSFPSTSNRRSSDLHSSPGLRKELAAATVRRFIHPRGFPLPGILR